MVQNKRDTGAYALYPRQVVPCMTIDSVAQYKERLFPSDDRTTRSSSMPTNHAAVRQELERIKAEKAALRAQREHEGAEDPSPSEGVKRLV